VSDAQLKQDSADRTVTNHEEADAMVCFHATSVSDEGETENTVVRASDTDIAVILICQSPTVTSTLWMDNGSSTKNTRRYINLTAIGAKLGSDVRKSLLAFHTFTGCDTSAFVRKGKVKTFAKLVKSKEAQRVLAKITSDKSVSNDTMKAVQSFTNSIYQHHQVKGRSWDASQQVPLQSLRESLQSSS